MKDFIATLLKYAPKTLGVLFILLVASLNIFLSFYFRNQTQDYPIITPLATLEEKFYDWRNVKRLKPTTGSKLSVNPDQYYDNPVLIDLDDKSLNEIGVFPLPRIKYIEMMEKLKEYGAKVVGYDVFFPEKSTTCDLKDGEKSIDDLFGESIANFNDDETGRMTILAYTADQVENAMEPSMSILSSMLTANGLIDKPADGNIDPNNPPTEIPFKKIDQSIWPIQQLEDTESKFGFINMQEDRDGVFRHYALFARIMSNDLVEGSILLPSLGLQAYLSSLDQNDTQIIVNRDSKSELTINGKTMYIDTRGEVKINWVGDRTAFPAVSLVDLINAKKPTDLKNKYFFDHYQEYKKQFESESSTPEDKATAKEEMKKLEPYLYVDLKDKIVFVASSSTGYHDLRNTPLDGTMPGVYAHMTLTHNLLTQNFFKTEESSQEFSFMFLGAAMLILIFIMMFNKALLDIFTLASLMAATYYIEFYYFLPAGYEIRLGSIYFALIATYAWITLLNFNQASAEKKQIKGAFSRYVAPAIVDDMLDNPDKLKVGGERKDITCLFSDVRDFTSISEMLTPTELAGALNRYMGEMTDIVFETNGTLDKYIGDAIVAFWGAPLDIGDHVNQAMDGAVKMLEALPTINEEFKAKNLPEFKIGLGLNSGECNVGNMGSDAIFAYTALGDNMNLGARLESLCKHYGAQILVSEFTYERMDKEKFTCRCIDKVRVKGKTEPVGVYEVLYSYHPLTLNPDCLEFFKQGYDLYLAGKFARAKELFEKVLEKVELDKASLRMIENCKHWMENPPKDGDDWTITTMTTK